MVPLLARQDTEADYSTLDDAVAGGAFRVSEISEAGRVPELLVVNDMERSVLMFDGEELVGAKQNRIVNLTILVPAKSRLTVPVSCVEAGRWKHQSRNFTSANRAYYASGRAMKATHVTDSYRTSSRPLTNQGAIWSDISDKSDCLQTRSETSAMAAMYEQRACDLRQLEAELVPQPLQVGAIFALDGVPIGLDLLDSPATWRKLAPKLTASYGLDALVRAASRGTKGDQPERTFDPAELLSQVIALHREHYPAVGLGEDVRLSGPSLGGGALLVNDRLVHLAAFPIGASA